MGTNDHLHENTSFTPARKMGPGYHTKYAPIPGTLVIGMGHKARHGKDTAARTLIEAYPHLVQRFSFADDLYAVCRVVYGMTTKDAPLLQKVGVEYRERDPETWVRSVYSKILDAKPKVAVITDVRFPNEMAFVRAIGGECCKITRRTAGGVVFVDPSRPATHISETALDDAYWDTEIDNIEGNPQYLQNRVRDYLTFLMDVRRAA
jgi:hypothetical protein